MITKSQFEAFNQETGFLASFRPDSEESYNAANWKCGEDDPIGATFEWAIAYCAWFEKTYSVPCRLWTSKEHRFIRPFALGPEKSNHYERLRLGDFPWERCPPRYGLESALEWSVPRFLEPSEEVPEFGDGSGWGGTDRKVWIPEEQWPPSACLSESVVWKSYHGIDFIDAWDVYEWSDNGKAVGRYWEGPLAKQLWGEYKNCRVNFRIVISGGVQ